MHKIRLLEVAVVLLAVLLAAGCTETSSASNSNRAADEAGVRARAEQTQAGAAAKKALDERLKELQLRIDALKEDKPAKAHSHRAADSEMNKLHAEVTELRSKLSSPTGRTEEWDKLKDDTEQAFKKIEHKLDDLGHSK